MLSENWQKSRRSSESANCVEARSAGDVIQVRNSNDPTGPVVSFTLEEWTAFLGGVEDGDFNIA